MRQNRVARPFGKDSSRDNVAELKNVGGVL